MLANLKSTLYKIAFMVLFFVLAKSCVTDYANGGDKQKINNLTKMINDNTFVNADLSNNYTVTTIAKVIKLYKFDYSFKLNDEVFSGKITLNELPNTNKLKLFYLKENPKIVSANPNENLKKENEKGKSISDLLVGIVWGLLSLTLLVSLISKFKDKKRTINSTDEIKIKDVSDEDAMNKEAVERLKREARKKEKEDPKRFMP